MSSQRKSTLNNDRGAVVLSTLIVITLMIVVMVGVASIQVLQVAKDSYRVNQAFRYLNIMEEMGQLVGRARSIGNAVEKAGGTTCAAGTVKIPAAATTNFLCLPDPNGDGVATSAGIQEVCMVHKDYVGATETFCLKDVLIVTGVADNTEPNANRAQAAFRIEPRQRSLLTRVLDALLLEEANAVPCSCNAAIDVPVANMCCPGATAATPATEPTVPAITTTPATAGTQNFSDSTTPNTSYHNTETWFPTVTWTDSNEIYTPACTSNSDLWRGCMKCGVEVNSQMRVFCVDFEMCPPSEGVACANPYRQRVAVY